MSDAPPRSSSIVGAASHHVAVPPGRDPEGCDVRAFGAFTADLHVLADAKEKA
jgi:hypothetical protein